MITVTVDLAGLEKAITLEAQKVATDLYSGLVQDSPVDTGRLRNGWQLELGDNPVITNNVPYTDYAMESGTRYIAPRLLITANINRVCDR